MNTQQPEALQLANAHEQVAKGIDFPELALQTAAELRRLHSVNAELPEALQDVVDRLVDRHETDESAIAARAAIAKAQETV